MTGAITIGIVAVVLMKESAPVKTKLRPIA
jgi:hypothetical protein